MHPHPQFQLCITCLIRCPTRFLSHAPASGRPCTESSTSCLATNGTAARSSSLPPMMHRHASVDLLAGPRAPQALNDTTDSGLHSAPYSNGAANPFRGRARCWLQSCLSCLSCQVHVLLGLQVQLPSLQSEIYPSLSASSRRQGLAAQTEAQCSKPGSSCLR